MMGVTWDDFSLYLFTVKKLSRGTQKMAEYRYKSAFDKIKKFFETTAFDKNSCLLFFSTLEKQGYKPAALNNFLKLFRHLCRYLNVDYLNGFSYYKEIPPHIDTLSADEMENLVKAAYTLGYKEGVMIETLCRTGLRNGEMCKLEWKDVLSDRLVLRDTKIGKVQYSYIQPDLHQKITKLQKYNHEGVFGSEQGRLYRETINIYLRKAAKIANINKRIYAHLIRHSVATLAVKNNDNVFKVQKFMRHTKLDSTLRYSHLIIDDVVEIAESLPVSSSYMTFETVKKKAKQFYNQIKNTPCKKSIVESNNKIIIELSAENV